VRPAAIYGEGEQRHLPRIIKIINGGVGFFAIGGRDILCDWVHVDNLVHSMVLAAAAAAAAAPSATAAVSSERSGGSTIGDVTRRGGDVIRRGDPCGKAFAIGDGVPVNNFVFLRQLLGCDELFWMSAPTNQPTNQRC
jgi:nucleoside-diphosphate-sugar epimerase